MGIEKTRGQNYDLSRLLLGVKRGKVGLPEFQRDFLWDPTLVRQLLATALNGWPMGSLLLLPGSSERFFRVRPAETAPPLSEPLETIILDGQQRITSLFQALYATGTHRYAVSLEPLLNMSGNRYGIEDLEDALLAVPVRSWSAKYGDSGRHLRAGIIPAPALASARAFFSWRDSQFQVSDSEKYAVTELFSRTLAGLDRYEVPAVVIDSEVQPEAIARIFERVNRLGQPLGTFDLMVAKSFSPSFNLRDEWEAVCEAHPAIEDYLGGDGLHLLATISLKTSKSVRQSDVLRLPKEAVQGQWAAAVRGMEAAIHFLQRELGVFAPEVLPYKAMLPLLAALFMFEDSINRPELARFMWFAMFSGRYDVAANTRSASDYLELSSRRWTSGSRPPRLEIVKDKVLESSRRQGAAFHKAFMCLLYRVGAMDPVTGAHLGSEEMIESEIVQGSILDGFREFPSIAREATLGTVLLQKANRPLLVQKPLVLLDREALESQGVRLPEEPRWSLGELFEQRIEWLVSALKDVADISVAIVRVDSGIDLDAGAWRGASNLGL